MSDGNYGRQYGITQLAPGPRIVEFSITSEGLKIATYGEGVKIIPEPNVRVLRQFLDDFLGDALPSVADDKVEAVIQAAREWSGRFTNRDTRYLNAPSKQLYEAIRALDPPDPDAELVEKMAEWMANDWGAYSWTEAEPEAKDRWRTRANSLLNITRSQ